MMYFRTLLLVVWLIVVYFTVRAIESEGLAVAADVFSSDMSALNWRSQFNIDLISHMLLAGVWVAWRHRFSVSGILLGLLCINGGLFTLLYVLAISLIHKGDVTKILMGINASKKAA